MSVSPHSFRVLLPLAALVTGNLGCTPTPPELPAGLSAQIGQVEAPADEHLLLYPTGEPENLLGREVQLSKDGGYTISDFRAPGCEVSVRKNESQYERKYDADLKSMASASIGYAELVGLGAKYGTQVKASATVKNSYVLVADLRGTCGSRVVNSVRVGTGERSLIRSAESGAGLDASVSGVPLGADLGTKDSAELGGKFAWQAPQGYAFTYQEFEAVEPIGLTVNVPERLTEGETVSIEISAEKQVWVVVFFLESDDRGAVLIPGSSMPDPMIPAGGKLVLPPAKAALREAGHAARETLVVYAFTDKSDFDHLKPEPSSWDTAASKYAGELTQKLSSIPIRRWDRTAVGYVIEPAKKP